MPTVKVTPSGFMDKDTDIAYVGQGNYVDANDIRHRQTDENNFGGIMAVAGNSNLINIPSYTSSSKSYRIYVDVSKIADSSVSSNDGDLFLETNFGTLFSNLSLNISTTTLSSYISTLKGFFNSMSSAAYGGSFTYSSTTTTGTYTAYFDLSTSLDTDYFLKVNNLTASLCEIKLKNEYIASGGDFKVIGSQQLEEYLFVWLTSGTVSEIGLIYSTDKDITFNYVRLIRSKNFNFSVDRRVEAEIERNGDEVNIYWTDGFNKPRAMYLKYSLKLVTDAFLYTSGGRYDLSNIDSETTFFNVNTSSYLQVQSVTTGGALTSGNKRYTGRFLTDDLVPTDFLYPTNPINIYGASTAITSIISGDAEGTLTDKSVNIIVKNIPRGDYKYFELVAIEYLNLSYVAKIVQRYSLGEDAAELIVEHTNLGQDNIQLASNELLAITSKYLSVENMKIFDNRIVLSNIKEQIDYDLSAWAQQIAHSLETKTVTSVGSMRPSDFANPAYDTLAYRFGENLNPMNTHDFSSYMMNDTYRFGIQVQWKNTGKWSSPYWVDDIRFDTLSNNVIGPGITIGPTTYATRRIANNIDVNLTDENNNVVNNYHVKFHNVNLNYLVDTDKSGTGDTPIRNLISGFRFTRAKRIPEVLSTGYFLPAGYVSSSANRTYSPYFRELHGDAAFCTQIFTGSLGVNTTTNTLTFSAAHNLLKGQSLFFTTSGTPPSPLVTDTLYYAIIVSSTQIKLSADSDLQEIDLTTVGTGTFNFDTIMETDSVKSYPTSHISNTNGSDHLYYYSVDDYYSGGNYQFNTTLDELRILGVPNTKLHIKGIVNADEYASYNDNAGYFLTANQPYLRIADAGTTITLSDHTTIQEGERKLLSTGKKVFNGNENCPCIKAELFTLSTTLKASSGSNFTSLANSENAGIYYGQIFRNLGANKKYPIAKQFTQYESLGHFYFLSTGQTGVVNNISIFGGDVFNQKTHMHIKLNVYPSVEGGYAMGLYSQNTVNTQMLNIVEPDDSATGEPYVFPQLPKLISGPLPNDSAISYRIKYDAKFNVFSTIAVAAYLPTTEKAVVNGLFTWATQDRVQRYYNRSYDLKDNTIIESGFNSEASYDGTLPSRITWSAKKVFGSQKDNYRIFKPIDFADLDLTFGPIVHHEVINNSFYTWQPYSVQRQYFRDASLLGAQEGTDIVVGSGSILGSPGQQISSVGMFKKWSHVKGKNPTGKDTFYWFNDQVQKIIRFGDDGTRVISDRGLISYLVNNGKYVSGEDYPLSGKGVHGIWNDKYSEAIFTFKYTTVGETEVKFTLVYDEIKNGFICFHSYWPNIYLSYKNTFWSPNPSVSKALYLHDRGADSTYYGTFVVPTITTVMNYEPNASKNFEALQIVSDKNPFRLDFTTTNHVSFLTNTDFEQREDLWYSPIKNDSTGTGINSNDTSRLWGKWLKMKFSLQTASGKQKLINIMVKFRMMARLYNQ